MQRQLAGILVKLAIVCFTVSVLTTSFISAREKCWQMEGLRTLKRLAVATQNFARGNNGVLPPLDSRDVAQSALGAYFSPSGLAAWEVPGMPGSYFQPNASLSGKRLSSIRNPEEIVLFYEQRDREWRERSGLRVVYVDGDTKFIASSRWPRIAAQSGISLKPEVKTRQPWDLHLGEALLVLSLELLVVSGVLAVAARITRNT